MTGEGRDLRPVASAREIESQLFGSSVTKLQGRPSSAPQSRIAPVAPSSFERLLFDPGKHHFLLNGLGWGGMPLHAVRKDLEEGRLSVLPIEDVPPDGLILPMSAVWQTKSPPGPAGRWFIDRLKQIPVETGKVPKPPVTRKKAKRSAKT
jgi:hypothetical protein